VLLVLNGAAASVRSEEKKTPKPPPLTLELSYIEDAAHPDIFPHRQGLVLIHRRGDLDPGTLEVEHDITRIEPLPIHR